MKGFLIFTVREGKSSSEAASPRVDADIEDLLAAEALDEEGVHADHLGSAEHPILQWQYNCQ